jgi:hypothetical protein
MIHRIPAKELTLNGLFSSNKMVTEEKAATFPQRGESSCTIAIPDERKVSENIETSMKAIPATLSIMGLIFFLLASSVYFFFRNHDLSTLLIVIFFISSLLSSWSAVSFREFAREGGIVEIISWGIAMLDSIILVVLVLILFLGSSLYL